jgi:hypothetical protein
MVECVRVIANEAKTNPAVLEEMKAGASVVLPPRLAVLMIASRRVG